MKDQLVEEQRRSSELEQKNADLNSENERLTEEIMALTYDEESEFSEGEEEEQQEYGSGAPYSDEDEEVSRDDY